MLVPERVARWLRALADQVELGLYEDAQMNDEIVTVRERQADGSVRHHRTGERAITLRLYERDHYFTPQSNKGVRDVASGNGQQSPAGTAAR